MRKTRSWIGLGTVVVAAGLLLTACFTANISGGGKSPSPIGSSATGPTGPSSGAKLELSLKTIDSLGTGIGSAYGTLTDTGRNIAFPFGVKISFKGGTVFGIGEDCTVAGPARGTHVRAANAAGRVRGVVTCAPGSKVWFGFITYRSADTKHYPNTVNPECAYWYYMYIHYGSLGGAPVRLAKPTSAQLAAFQKSPNYQPMTGFGLLAIYDSNQDGRYGNGDFYSFSAGCGPYTALTGVDAPAVRAPAGLDPIYPGYNYGTCYDGAFAAPGGVVPNWLGVDPNVVLGSFFSGLGSGPCSVPLVTGNLTITPAVDWTSGPSGLIGPN